jgi:hypothetical protein
MRTFGWIITRLIALALTIGLVYGIAAANLTWWQPWARNKQTEITRNTNQYVTTQQSIIADAYGNFQDADRSITILRGTPVSDPSFNQTLINQELSTLQYEAGRMCAAANQIDSQYVPDYARGPMQQAGCWNGY